MKLLVAEDEEDLNRIITKKLRSEGYDVDSCFDGEEALERLLYVDYDAAVLDIVMPVMDGMETVRRLRRNGRSTPVIFLTARDTIPDKVGGLDAGANDYVVKPFVFDELLARIRAALRKRENRPADQDLRFTDGDLLVDYERRRVEVDGQEVHLTPIEYKILLLLIANRGKVLTHHYILKEVWGYAEGVEAGTLRVFMATLRRKIEKNPSRPQHIITEVGVGYRFK